ncbi:hypothetical protein Tco_1114745 [Tanacetum coccineum]
MSEASDDIQKRELHQLQLMQENAKESCMTSFWLLHSFLQVLSYDESKSRRVSERAFMILFGQDNKTFTSTMSLNLDQLQRQLVKDEFQEDKSMAALWVIDNQFQKFIDWQDFVDYDSQMTEKFFAEYTGIKVTRFKETLLQHMGNVKKYVAERARSALDVVSSQALDADLVVMERNGTESGMHDTSSSSGNYITHVVDANIRPVNDQVPFAEDSLEFREFFEINELKAQLQAKNSTINNLKKQIKHVHVKSNEAKVKHDIDVLETINIELESSVAKLLAENENKTVENADLKAQIQEKVFANAALKNELRKLKGTCVDTKFAKPSILGKPVLQPPRNQSVVRQPNAFKSERPNFSKPRFASQVDVNNVLSKPVTPHYLPKVREYVLAKPHHVIAPGSSRNSQEESYGSNDMAHNHYLEEARKKTQERNRNSKPSVMHTTSLQNTTNGSKPNPRSNNQISRSLPVSKSSCGMSNGVSLVDHSRNSSSFSDSKHFVCSSCHKCVFDANHDNCITKFLKEVNSRAKIQSPKTRNNNKPVEPKSHTQKPGRQIAIGQRFSPTKSSNVHEKPNTPRSCLRRKLTGRIFKIAGLRWIPTGKMFTDNTTKVDSEPPNGSNDDITNPYECNQTLNVSACTTNLSAVQASLFNDKMTSTHISSGLALQRQNDVCSHQFRPHSSSIDNVCSRQFRPRSSTIDDVCSHQFRPRSSTINGVC